MADNKNKKVEVMKLELYQVDAFATEFFEGNPAAIVPLRRWLPDELMQQIAMENNLSETAFFVKQDDKFGLRWFTPEAEVDLCGHATLASAHVLFNHHGIEAETIIFETKSGELVVTQEGDLLKMDFPTSPVKETEAPGGIAQALDALPTEFYMGMDFLFLLKSEKEVRDLDPDFAALKKLDTRGIIVTAPGDEEDVDFISRFFAPAVGINEDPVTGSAHCALTPFWADRLGKDQLTARQISKRGGTVQCRLDGDRVELAGQARTFLKGVIEIPDYWLSEQ